MLPLALVGNLGKDWVVFNDFGNTMLCVPTGFRRSKLGWHALSEAAML